MKFWSGSAQLETNEALDAVIHAILTAYQQAGIELTEEVWQVELGPATVQALRELPTVLPRIHRSTRNP